MTAPAQTLDPKAFRAALGRFATGVTIVTTRDAGGAPIGVTANSFNSVSLDPPMVLWSLAKNSNSMQAFSTASHFAVHILAEGQEELSSRFASRGADRFAGLETGAQIVPLLESCAARFVCRTAFQYEGGDHVIFVGEVIEFESAEKAPLLFLGGRYAGARRAGRIHADGIDPDKARIGGESLTHLIARAHTQIARRIHDHLEECALQQPRLMMMIAIGQHDHPDWGEVSVRVTATGYKACPEARDELIARGWIETVDGRFSLTEPGRQQYFNALSRMRDLEEHFCEGLSASECAEARHILSHIIARVADERPALI
jgi:3-hydroxy-9,10-secoandrosta-1,3,5(10)-triene-9,17-dione monooxygenase reductase component